MATLRNLGHSDLSVPALNNRVVAPDEVVETDNDTARGFLGQDTWGVELDDEDPRTLPELKAELAERGLPTSGRKADLIERLAAPAPAPEQGE